METDPLIDHKIIIDISGLQYSVQCTKGLELYEMYGIFLSLIKQIERIFDISETGSIKSDINVLH